MVAASESPPTAGRPTFSLSELAALLQVNRNTVSAWVKRGCPYVRQADRAKGQQWAFDLAEVVEWREAQAVLNALGDSHSLDLDEARRRKLTAEAALAELELAKARGDAVSIGDIEKVWTELITNFRSKMLALPQRLAPILAGETQERQLVKLFQADIFEALDELSRYAIDVSDLSDHG